MTNMSAALNLQPRLNRKNDGFSLRPLALLGIHALLSLALLSCAERPASEPEATPPSGRTVIGGALVIDGTGAPGREATVVVEGGIISAIVDAGTSFSFQDGDHVVAVQNGHVLAPGFIDAHSHHDWGLLDEPGAEAAVSQGITTIIVGQDGGSNTRLADWFGRLEEQTVAVNVASYSGHNSHRAAVLGDDFRRTASPEELEQMKELLRADMQAGALGLATGLEYDPGIYSSRDEVLRAGQGCTAGAERPLHQPHSQRRPRLLGRRSKNCSRSVARHSCRSRSRTSSWRCNLRSARLTN